MTACHFPPIYSSFHNGFSELIRACDLLSHPQLRSYRCFSSNNYFLCVSLCLSLISVRMFLRVRHRNELKDDDHPVRRRVFLKTLPCSVRVLHAKGHVVGKDGVRGHADVRHLRSGRLKEILPSRS